MSVNFVILVFSCLALCASSQNITYRLPGTVVPSHYALSLETNMQNFTFNGVVTINATALNSTNQIVLHSKDLNVTSVTLVNATLSSVGPVNTTTDFLTIHLAQNVTVNASISIQLVFNGTLGTGNVGYYRASYVNATNHTRYLAVTHFESTNARRAFPCFDQPNMKATFQVSLTRNATYRSTSNMNALQSVILADGRVTDIYNTSVPMATYLVAFMISDYDYVESINNTVTYRTYGRSELIARGDGNYSLLVASRAIQAMENITNISYVLNTMDQVAVPNEYYKIGAMENWGMVTYREKYLMYNASNSTASEKQQTVTLISHEFAHQWYGNLVTPEWWKYIWLNEGFATYYELIVGNQIEPTWKLVEQFVTSIMQRALVDDSLATSKPMTRDAESPSEIEALYDTIVYEKAGSVIRMMANFLGETVFKNGLTSYLNASRFGNVNPQKLYSSWQTSLNNNSINISSVMASWETQSGYPLLTVTRGTNVTVTQQRYLMNNITHNDTTLWSIPLTWFTINGTSNGTLLLTTQNTTITGLNLTSNQWIIFNTNQTGFYRVNYDQNNWQLIINYLTSGNYSAIPVINRAQLVDDSFMLARSGHLNYSLVLDLGYYILNETEYVPIATFTNALSHLDRLMTGTPNHEAIRTYGRSSLQGYFNRSGFITQNDDHLTRLTKVTVLTWLCNFEHVQCRNTSRDAFQSWINQSTAIQPDSQYFVFCNGIRQSNESNWQLALERYSSLREDTQRTRIAQGLGCANNETILLRLLNLVIAENSTFNSSDKIAAVTSVYTNNGVLGVNVTLRWLSQNFTVINQRVGSVSSIISGVSSRITTSQLATAFTAFVNATAGNFSASLNETVQTAFTNINTNLEWVNSTSTEFEDIFRESASTMLYYQIFLLLASIFVHFLYR